MPKKGYYSLTIKKRDAEVFLKVARHNNVSVVEFFSRLAYFASKDLVTYDRFREAFLRGNIKALQEQLHALEGTL